MKKRQVLSIVRCQAVACAVPTSVCEGSEKHGRCPYYNGQTGSDIECSYDPMNPRKIKGEDGQPRLGDRDSAVLDKEHRPQVHQYFSVQVTGGQAEWKNAQANI